MILLYIELFYTLPYTSIEGTDLTEKQLFELEDVFADIVNVLLLDGKSLILPEDLTPAKKDSLYKEKELAVTKDNRFIEMYRFYIQNRLHFFNFHFNSTTVAPAPPSVMSARVKLKTLA